MAISSSIPAVALEAIVHFCPAASTTKELLLQKSDGTYVPYIILPHYQKMWRPYELLYRTLLHLSTNQESLHASLIEIAASVENDLSTFDHQPLQAHVYPKVTSSAPFPFDMKAPALVTAEEKSSADIYTRSAVGLSYSRTLELLRRQLGPHFDLEKLWEKHTYYVGLILSKPDLQDTHFIIGICRAGCFECVCDCIIPNSNQPR